MVRKLRYWCQLCGVLDGSVQYSTYNLMWRRFFTGGCWPKGWIWNGEHFYISECSWLSYRWRGCFDLEPLTYGLFEDKSGGRTQSTCFDGARKGRSSIQYQPLYRGSWNVCISSRYRRAKRQRPGHSGLVPPRTISPYGTHSENIGIVRRLNLILTTFGLPEIHSCCAGNLT